MLVRVVGNFVKEKGKTCIDLGEVVDTVAVWISLRLCGGLVVPCG